MIFDLPLKDVVSNRKSVRTFLKKNLSQTVIDDLNRYISALDNPFSVKVRFELILAQSLPDTVSLGTYGMIKGASDFIGVTVENTDMCLEAVGYEFEKLILYAASKGLGTCWLGGTFNKHEFAKTMEIGGNELFPAVSPIGYSAEKKRVGEKLVRLKVNADRRKPWSELFFADDFSKAITPAGAGDYASALEMVRLAPSASNKQPWRIVKNETGCHFYEFKLPGYSDRFTYDIQRIDMGIAACHFHLASIENNLSGSFIKQSSPISVLPENYYYAFTWICG